MKKIEKAKKRLLEKETFEKLSNFYSLFADSTRLSIISLLINQELCVSDITEVLGISQSRVSHQLAILRNQNIVSTRRKSKKVLYSLTDNHIKDLFKTGLNHYSEKDEEILKDKKAKGY